MSALIDRDILIEAAITVVKDRGAMSLTFDSIALAANTTKSRVQVVFKTRERMIDAVCAAALTADTSDADRRRVAFSLILLKPPVERKLVQDWYETKLATMDPNTDAGRHDRLKFCIDEGYFILSLMGFSLPSFNSQQLEGVEGAISGRDICV
ncbi:hypothetical protein [Falsirhodobacter sp. 1013]|uniref:hypothetical protein n=1 Tax=Falsirhodobacter sp. 1013 TaxID=3417566 RepID=UPI003EB8F772